MRKHLITITLGALLVPLLGGAAYAAAHSVGNRPDPQVVIPASEIAPVASATPDDKGVDPIAPTTVDDHGQDPVGHDAGDDKGVDPTVPTTVDDHGGRPDDSGHHGKDG